MEKASPGCRAVKAGLQAAMRRILAALALFAVASTLLPTARQANECTSPALRRAGGGRPPGGGARTARARAEGLRSACRRLGPDSSFAAARQAKALGREVVYLRGKEATAAVCIPHKVGSHAWGRFAAAFNGAAGSPPPTVTPSLRAVVVRHPMERLLSVYRMIFEDWCDQERWLAKQWNNVCKDSSFAEGEAGGDTSLLDQKRGVGDFVLGMLDEHLHGNDRYVIRIWKKFNPGKQVRKENLKFTFGEFVRLVVNVSLDFANDPYVLKHQGLSYHWLPYWQECSLCSNATFPNMVVHLDTVHRDVDALLAAIGGSRLATSNSELFPHTHYLEGGSSSDREVVRRYFSTLTKGQVRQLFRKYQLDHELFSFSPDDFIRIAK